MKKITLVYILFMACLCSCKKKEIYPATTSAKTEIQSFRLVTEAGVNVISSVTIDQKQSLITVLTSPGITLGSLFPSAVVSEGAIVKPAMGAYTDFTKPVQYTVIAGNRQDQQVWTIKVNP
ncbi:hypothetical protein DBR11_08580 [Pedobacter sp. HMWF019]|uniref:hypothetical protein n=1 Tax=Pedobacter sp. HMWF019 TaxID=2056856 RepID=UPI000D3D803C|nr:hypothetical protein [Pedobacter sp. HMWF019]PTT00933.1 hypothetical protein DBR11_08580 [Pedobacter sp. HMWF019]